MDAKLKAMIQVGDALLELLAPKPSIELDELNKDWAKATQDLRKETPCKTPPSTTSSR